MNATTINLETATPAQLERLADALLDAADAGPTATERRSLTEARQAKARQTAVNRIDRWVSQQDIPAVRADLLLAGQATALLLARATAAPARRTVSRAERREATRLVDKLAVRKSSQGKRADNAAIKAQRQRIAAIAAGTAVVVPSNPFPCQAVPTVSRARLAVVAAQWDNPAAGIAAAWEAFLAR